ncbi:hypothetical protein DFH09DRAFT_1322733 [Mycena vulgaris]|nr:hypothetical protein DFH09DRAFT_1322733 [Mycena vulgaris]
MPSCIKTGMPAISASHQITRQLRRCQRRPPALNKADAAAYFYGARQRLSQPAPDAAHRAQPSLDSTMPMPTLSCSGRCHAAASAVAAVATTKPWGGLGGDDGQMPSLMQSRHC